MARHGRIDVLVNNAGMVQTGIEAESRTLATMAEADWDFEIALNLKTCFTMTRAVVPGMIERATGGSSTSSSVTGPLVVGPDVAGYRPAKAGIDGMMRGLAIEVGRYGVTVNSVAAGLDRDGLVAAATRSSPAAPRRSAAPAGRRRSPT